jgi:threonyl-tRNA synthetase
MSEINTISLELPDGSRREYAAGVTGREVAESIGKRLAADALAIKLDDQIQDLARPIARGGKLTILTPKTRDGKLDPDALYVLRHSTAHVMAEAICKLWPETKLVYGPPVDDGFYYDIELSHKISADEFSRIEDEMRKLVAAKTPFTRVEMPREEGLKKVSAEGNPYKLDNAQRADGVLSFYVTGTEPGTSFEDLCRGPHVPDTGRIGAFKVTSIAGAYWHGDATKRQLQRVYGTAFPTQKDLDEHITRLEEAKKRDHRVIGKQLGLFTMSPLVGQGLVLWMPKGALIRTELQNLMYGELMKRGYQPVFTPHIGNVEMYKKSGHFPYYKDSQYPTLKAELKPGETSVEEYLLKPMNCPHHIQIYSAEPRSYRELPVRLAEFGTVYRYEQSGELNGMLRVRGLTQDDAHIFCMDEQVEMEIRAMVDLVLYVFGCLGLDDYRVQVSLRDPDSDKYTGDPNNWNKAEDTLRRIAREMNLKHEVARGEAAFYGPKLDFHVKDCIGREWQLGTVQLDYNLPERFDLEYVGSDNQRHRPVMIHRAPFGSFERFVGVLIEHFAGAFPLWLAPVQVRVANITDQQEEPARRALRALLDAGFRADIDLAHGRINAKVAEFEVSKIPYLLVIGEREAQEEKVAVRARGNKNKGVMPLKQFIELAGANVRARSLAEIG